MSTAYTITHLKPKTKTQWQECQGKTSDTTNIEPIARANENKTKNYYFRTTFWFAHTRSKHHTNFIFNCIWNLFRMESIECIWMLSHGDGDRLQRFNWLVHFYLTSSSIVAINSYYYMHWSLWFLFPFGE